MEETTLKQGLIERFNQARNTVGLNWRRELIKSSNFYDTYEGVRLMISASAAAKDPLRCGHDKLDRIVRDLEKLVSQLQTAEQ